VGEGRQGMITVGGLIRGRRKITECWLKHLAALEVSGLDISWRFVLDNPEGWEMDLVAKHLPNPLFHCVKDDSLPYLHGHGCRLEQHTARLARLRNRLVTLSQRLPGCEPADGLLNVDSDIMVPAGLLKGLLAAERPWVGALVDNASAGLAQQKYYNAFNIAEKPSCELTAIRRFPPVLFGIGEADCVGAVAYYSREILEAAMFADHPLGEDVGFGVMAKRAGFRAAYLPIICDHLMDEEKLARHRARCPLCG